MALAKIKTAEERDRLDRIFAEVEAAEHGEPLEPVDIRTQEQRDEDNRRAKIDRLANLEIKEFVGNVKSNIGNNAFTTRWEKAERTAKEQDNHHYYKLFAEQVKSLLEKL